MVVMSLDLQYVDGILWKGDQEGVATCIQKFRISHFGLLDHSRKIQNQTRRLVKKKKKVCTILFYHQKAPKSHWASQIYSTFM